MNGSALTLGFDYGVEMNGGDMRKLRYVIGNVQDESCSMLRVDERTLT